jgi:hypothetical protein
VDSADGRGVFGEVGDGDVGAIVVGANVGANVGVAIGNDVGRREGANVGASVGEAMGIGRSFPEALQKALQMLNIGVTGLHDYPWPIHDISHEIAVATDRRIFALYSWFYNQGSINDAYSMSKIDKWFLTQIKQIADFTHEIENNLLDYNENGSIEMINSSINIIAKILNLKILIGNIKTYISPYIIDNLPFNIILGRDFLIKNNTIINFKNSNIIISGRLIEY